jgi:hypothetical protein
MTSDTLILQSARFPRFPDLQPDMRDALERALRLERQCGEIVRAAKGGLPQSEEARAFYEHVAALKRCAWLRYHRLDREWRRRRGGNVNVIAESHLHASNFQFLN